MNINEEKRHQWQALKGMGFKAHWDYFWDYYKIHVIVAVFVIVGIISLVRDIVNQKPDALNVSIINAAGVLEATSLQEGFAEYKNIDTTKYNITIDSTSAINLTNPDSYTIANSERIYSMLAAHDLDIIMADKDVFANYARSEMFKDLRECFSEDELSALGDLVFYVDTADYNTGAEFEEEPSKDDENVVHELIPVGVILNDNPHLTELEYYKGATPIVGIAVTSERFDAGADFIRYLLQ